MPFDSKGLRRLSHGGVVGAGSANIQSLWHYATNDAAAVVEAANYFNSAAGSLVVGDIILASIDIDGTPTARKYVVLSNDGTTVAIAAGGEVRQVDLPVSPLPALGERLQHAGLDVTVTGQVPPQLRVPFLTAWRESGGRMLIGRPSPEWYRPPPAHGRRSGRIAGRRTGSAVR